MTTRSAPASAGRSTAFASRTASARSFRPSRLAGRCKPRAPANSLMIRSTSSGVVCGPSSITPASRISVEDRRAAPTTTSSTISARRYLKRPPSSGRCSRVSSPSRRAAVGRQPELDRGTVALDLGLLDFQQVALSEVLGVGLERDHHVVAFVPRSTRPSSRQPRRRVDLHPSILRTGRLAVVFAVGREPHREQAPGRRPWTGGTTAAGGPSGPGRAAHPPRARIPCTDRDAAGDDRAGRARPEDARFQRLIVIAPDTALARVDAAETAPAAAPPPALNKAAARTVAWIEAGETGHDRTPPRTRTRRASPRRVSRARSRSRPAPVGS